MSEKKTCPSCNGRKSHHNPSTHDDEPCRQCHGTGYVTAIVNATTHQIYHQVTSPQEVEERKRQEVSLDVHAINEALKMIDFDLKKGNTKITFDGRVSTSLFGNGERRAATLKELWRVLAESGWTAYATDNASGITVELRPRGTITVRPPAITRSGNSG